MTGTWQCTRAILSLWKCTLCLVISICCCSDLSTLRYQLNLNLSQGAHMEAKDHRLNNCGHLKRAFSAGKDDFQHSRVSRTVYLILSCFSLCNRCLGLWGCGFTLNLANRRPFQTVELLGLSSCLELSLLIAWLEEDGCSSWANENCSFLSRAPSFTWLVSTSSASSTDLPWLLEPAWELPGVQGGGTRIGALHSSSPSSDTRCNLNPKVYFKVTFINHLKYYIWRCTGFKKNQMK